VLQKGPRMALAASLFCPKSEDEPLLSELGSRRVSARFLLEAIS
jgi:hypothetical protein